MWRATRATAWLVSPRRGLCQRIGLCSQFHVCSTGLRVPQGLGFNLKDSDIVGLVKLGLWLLFLKLSR